MTQTHRETARTGRLDTILPIPRGEGMPCTLQQEGLWFEHQLNPDSSAYHMGFALRLRGALDVGALRSALSALIVRHEVLRTRFVGQGGLPRQVVDDPAEDFELRVEPVEPAAVEAWAAAQVDEPMDLATGPLLRVRLAGTGPQEYVLVLVLHHIVGDGWSIRLLGEELSRLYTAEVTGGEADLTPLPIQSADHAAWQRSRVDDAEVERQLAFWVENLADLPTIDLPTDRPRPAQPTGEGGFIRRELPVEVGSSAREFARTRRVSFLAVLHAALLCVLNRWTGQEDLPVGSVFSGRNRPEVEPLVGLFVNQVVLRTSVAGEPSFEELVQRCHECIMDAAAHEDTPFNVVVEAVQPERVAGRNPLFQVGFTLQSTGPSFPDLCPERLETTAEVLGTGHSMFDVEIEIDEAVSGRLTMRTEYSSELFDAERVERLVAHFGAALAGGLADPQAPASSIEVMDRAEREHVLTTGNDTTMAYPTTLLHHLVENQARTHPEAVAVLDHDGTTHTYRELDRAANRLAHHLRTHLDPDTCTPVGVSLHRGIGLVTALLACWKAGATYLPLDPDLPRERLHRLHTDATPAAVITTSTIPAPPDSPPRIHLDTETDILDTHPDTAPPNRLTPHDPAYILYTSGSTGTPKGVQVPHHGLTNRIQWMQDAYPIDATDTVLHKTPYTFDVSLWELIWPLTTGARLVIAAPDGHRDPHYLHDLIEHRNITTAHFVPTMLETYLDHLTTHEPTPHDTLRQVFCSGEALTTDTANRLLDTLPHTTLHNLYGPTEASIDVTAWTCHPSTDPTPIGLPIANHRAYVLDRHLRPVPLGVPGHLHIAGTGLAHGYLNQPTTTATTFIADPYTPHPGTRMYATGDLVRRRTDGTLDYLGRTDRQTKLNGQRLEPAEVETTLTTHPDITHATVQVHHDTLTAYLLPTPGTTPDPTRIREHLADRLPVYMIPTHYITLDELPLTTSGKLDHNRLPHPTDHTPTHQPPTTPTEHWLTTTCTDLLDTTTPIGMHHTFFDIGGNSLHATRLLARIRDHYDIHLHLRDLFTHPTLAHLATLIDNATPTHDPTTPTPPTELDSEIAELERRLAERTELERLLAEKRAAKEKRKAARRIEPVPRGEGMPCTLQQEGLWFEHQLNPDSSAYHIAFALRLRGALDVGALRSALSALIVRHEVLRTRFVGQGGLPRQVVDDPAEDFELRVEPVEPAAVEAWAAAQVDEPMDLATGPLLRVRLAGTGPQEYVLVLVLHHIVGDGWSIRLLGEELSRLYTAEVTGGEADLTPLPIQSADHAAWQRSRVDDAEVERQLAFWVENLADLPTIDLPTDRPRPAQPTGAGTGSDHALPEAVGHAAREFARTRRVSFLAVLHAALLCVLNRWTGQEDLPVGSVFSGRNRPEVEPLVGLFVNQVVLRTSVAGEPSFEELVQRCHECIMDATTYQDLPFTSVVEALQPKRVAGRNPLFQVNLTLQPPSASLGGLRLHDVAAEPLSVDFMSSHLDLSLGVTQDADGSLVVGTEYSSELFDAERVERLVAHFGAALAGGLADPQAPASSIEVMDRAEREHVLTTGNDTTMAYPTTLLHHLVENQARTHPEAVAVLDHDGTTHTYRELDRAANRLAHHLRTHLDPDTCTPVGVSLHRGIGLVTALLACWKAGATYLPLDPDLPRERLHRLHTDATPAAVITTSTIPAPPDSPPRIHLDTETDILDTHPDTAPPNRLTPHDPAYILYTSGSTGTPKGVQVPHHGLTNRIQWMQDAYPIDATDTVLHKTPYTFDVSLWELIWPLTTGARLVIAAPDGHRDPHYLHDLIEHRNITTAHFVPTMLETYLDHLTTHEPTPHDTLRQVFCSGEALTTDTANRLLDTLPHTTLHNLYGPTEASIDVTAWTCHPSTDPTPIGLPIANHRAYVLDRHLRPVPLGVPGHLHIAGTGLAHGYLNQPTTTATTFIADPYTPHPGTRMYATGDLVRRRTDGTLDYLGRTDRQTKLNGQRLEPAEVETTLTTHPDITHATVQVHHDTLTAYLLPTPGTTPDPTRIREHLADRLPVYMIPTHYITLDELPLTTSGKLDHNRLPHPTDHTPTHQPPTTPTEHWLTTTCTDLLDTTTPIGMHHTFFDIGGNSLHATRLLARIRDHYDIHLHLRDLFTHPTLAHLATLIDNATPTHDPTTPTPPTEPPTGSLVTFRSEGSRPPLFLIHPVGGSVAGYAELAVALGEDQPVHAIEDPALHGQVPPADLAERAEAYARLIREVLPHGPYLVGGWSLGGVIAHETARLLGGDGDAVTVLALDAATVPERTAEPDDLEVGAAFLTDLAGSAAVTLPDIDRDTLHDLGRPALEKLALDTLIEAGVAPEALRDELHTRLLAFEGNYRGAFRQPTRRGEHTVVLISAADNPEGAGDRGWLGLTPDLRRRTTPGDHYTMWREPNLGQLTTNLAAALKDATVTPRQPVTAPETPR